MATVQWHFRLSDGEKGRKAPPEVEWDWAQQGPPDLGRLWPAREPKSTAKSRHVPVRAFSTTMGKHLHLESGTEHDLLRIVDRDPKVMRVKAQPCRLQFAKKDSHIPDLLTESTDGTITVWDVRPEGKVGDKLHRDAERTGAACREVGWHYELWSGSELQEQLKTLWLTCARDRPAWAHQYVPVLARAALTPGATVGDLRALDDPSGELTATMWHLIWGGQIVLAVGMPLQDWTPVSWRGGAT